MPSWKIHLEYAKKINKYLKFENEAYTLFLVGSILPDINNGYLVPNVSRKIEHDITHFGKYNDAKSYKQFYNIYHKEIENMEPLFLGYLFHLYVDYRWNKDFYNKVKNIKRDEQKKEELRKAKQSDFLLYANNYIENYIEVESVTFVIDECRKIKEVSIDVQDILEAIAELNTYSKYNAVYTFYTKEKLDKLRNSTFNGIKRMLVVK